MISTNEIGMFRHFSEGIILSTMTQKKAYVYAIVVDGVVRYIGKGTGRRMHHHAAIAQQIMAKRETGEKVRGSLFYNKLAKALTNGSVVQPEVIVADLSDASAYAREREEIESYPDGQLWNVFAGGMGSTREDCLKAWENPDRRRSHRETMAAFLARPDVKKRISEGTKRGLARTGVLEARRVTQTKAFRLPENRAKKSAKSKEMWLRPGYRDKFMRVQRVAFSQPEVRERMSAAASKRMEDPSYKAKVSQGIKQTRASQEHKKKSSDTSKSQWLDPAYREKTTAAIRASSARRKMVKAS